MNKISLTRRKINVQVSRRRKPTRNKFHEQNQFHEVKYQCTSFTKRKVNMQQVSRTNNQHSASSKNQRSARTKFHVSVYPSSVEMILIGNE